MVQILGKCSDSAELITHNSILVKAIGALLMATMVVRLNLSMATLLCHYESTLQQFPFCISACDSNVLRPVLLVTRKWV